MADLTLDEHILTEIVRKTVQRPRFGCSRIHVLLRRERWRVNLKRVRRLYRLVDRRFRVLTVVDEWSRLSPILEVASSMSEQAVAEALDRAIDCHGHPVTVTVDHGTEFTSRAMDEWAYRRSVKLDYIRPGSPVESGFIESFNGRLREECLDANQFWSIDDARRTIEGWWVDYNHHRPHSSLGQLTPSEYFRRGQQRIKEAAFSWLRNALNRDRAHYGRGLYLRDGLKRGAGQRGLWHAEEAPKNLQVTHG